MPQDFRTGQRFATRHSGIGPPDYTADQFSCDGCADGPSVPEENVPVSGFWPVSADIIKDRLEHALGHWKDPLATGLAAAETQCSGGRISVVQTEVYYLANAKPEIDQACGHGEIAAADRS